MRSREFTLLREYSRDITAQRLGQKILARERDKNLSLDEILAQMEAADSTPTKQYTEWIARRYAAGDFLLEDLSVVRQYLDKFIESRRLIPNKDINSYTLGTLKELIRGIYKSGSAASDSKDETGVYPVLPDTDVLYNGPLGQLVIPLTVKASQALQRIGKVSEWCTADSRAPTHFPEYTQEGPLYVWIDSSGNKWQFHFPTQQYMDQFDVALPTTTLNMLMKGHPVLAQFLMPHCTDLSLLPAHKITRELAERAVAENGMMLGHVPRKFITLELCWAAVEQNSEALEEVPEEFHSEELFITAVSTGGSYWTLSFVPEEWRTRDICLAAVNHRGSALEYVPWNMKTHEICRAAVENSPWALGDVPPHMLTVDMCVDAVRRNPNMLKYIKSEKLQDAVKQRLGMS